MLRYSNYVKKNKVMRKIENQMVAVQHEPMFLNYNIPGQVCESVI